MLLIRTLLTGLSFLWGPWPNLTSHQLCGQQVTIHGLVLTPLQLWGFCSILSTHSNVWRGCWIVTTSCMFRMLKMPSSSYRWRHGSGLLWPSCGSRPARRMRSRFTFTFSQILVLGACPALSRYLWWMSWSKWPAVSLSLCSPWSCMSTMRLSSVPIRTRPTGRWWHCRSSPRPTVGSRGRCSRTDRGPRFSFTLGFGGTPVFSLSP